MRIDIVRCDWCGFEKQYDPHQFAYIHFTRYVREWADPADDRFDLCDECTDIFVTMIVSRRKKVDAK